MHFLTFKSILILFSISEKNHENTVKSALYALSDEAIKNLRANSPMDLGRNERVSIKRNYVHYDVSPVMHIFFGSQGSCLNAHSSVWQKYVQMEEAQTSRKSGSPEISTQPRT